MEEIMDTNDKIYDHIVLGAGPAGLQLGYFLEKDGRDYLVLEGGNSAGTFFKTFPRHRTLISNNKVHTGYTDPEVNMRFDWNSLMSDDPQLVFKNYSELYFPAADDFVRYLGDFAERTGVKIRYNTRIAHIARNADGFVLTSQDGDQFRCRRLVAATGFTKPYLPPIVGIELAENYTDVSVDPKDFTNKRVLILGKGNSAFETAENPIQTAAVIHVASPHPLKLAWKTHFVGHLRAVNNNFLDSYQLKMQNAVIDGTVEKIERQGDSLAVSVHYSHAHGETEVLLYDHVIVCTGFSFDSSIFDDNCKPHLVINDRFPAQTSAWESVNVPDLYFVGTINQMRDFKKTTSGFIHGYRYNAEALSRILAARYHDTPWPSTVIAATPQGILEALEARINRTSALWQQFGFLCEVVSLCGDGTARYYEQIPMEYVNDGDFGEHFRLTLEFGHIEGDPFAIERHPAPDQAEMSVFLHPVLRHYVGHTMLAIHHVLENLFGEWKDEELHLAPLRAFVAAELGMPVQAEVEDASFA
jgi:thioredoxin reductase